MPEADDEELCRGCDNRSEVVLRVEEAAWEMVPGELPVEVQQRMQVIQRLLSAEGTKSYGAVQERSARELGISVRSLQRLVKRWRESGLTGLRKQVRSDQGETKISQDWQEFIIKTYREGNRGSRSMSAAQVWLRVKARAAEKGLETYPSRTTVYRMLKPYIEKRQQKRSLGWRHERLSLSTREGLAIGIEWSNQVWQVDHTRADVLVVDQGGEVLGRPWLTIVVDTYSRCIMGVHIGFDAPSAAVVCLALRHAILPKQYSGGYELKQSWGTYGLPQYLYTDGGKDFRSQHLEQVATELGIVLCLRRKPSDGGIVERPFGTLNREFFSSLPGYTGSSVEERYEQAQASPTPQAEAEACLTLQNLEKLLVRYLVDHYNQEIDARMGDQSRVGRWEAGRIAQLPLLGERELDLCLMRRDRRMVYRSGYIQFANLTYQGEHLAAYAGESIVVRYNPRDITTVYIYQLQEGKEVFLTRAHAVGWETEILSYKEAQALSERRRSAGKAIDKRLLLTEVREACASSYDDRDERVKKLQRQKKQKLNGIQASSIDEPSLSKAKASSQESELQLVAKSEESTSELEIETVKPKKPVPYVRVYDYEQLKREAGLL